ncbi:organic hydroperoxide resistance protein [Kaistia dalseonensis]|uniref:Ohr subfamily peroxiredoxin n=1 Tax=Kaistia dalseonensis TaxID=410840 RepID=A0ABU0H178_9HYPH|nr:organic hydroperoxide resistance protein [Kaistia dalseonensis]MCX5493492.1 organic hydroperoxide resistance protein [Kaistia dalseonensis]MDQ0436052.1 Ohr subfamily peroxiredoxin [Kaistia dalseonensis]
MSVLYTAAATSTGSGREGHTTSSDGRLDLQLNVPKEMGGNGGPGTNPEQLFAAGYSACFLSALRFVAGKEKAKVPDGTTVTADVGIGPKGEGFGLEVTMEVSLPGLDQAAAEALVAKAHAVCPYSQATRGNIDVKLAVTV